MIALMVFNRDRYKWEVWAVSQYGEFSYSAHSVSRRLNDEGREKYQHIIDVEIKAFDFKDGKYSVTISDGEKLPDTPTLESSIEECKIKLRAYLNG